MQGNSTQLNLLQVSFYDFANPNKVDEIDRKMVYDDSVLLTFNHVSDTGIAAMTIKGEDEELVL